MRNKEIKKGEYNGDTASGWDDGLAWSASKIERLWEELRKYAEWLQEYCMVE